MPDTIAPRAAPHPDAWPEPDGSLLEERRPNLPELPLHALPPFWRGWIGDTAAALETPVDYVLQALLASVAGICGAGVVARVTPSWDEPLILWQALVGGPSHGKRLALDAQRRALAAVEKTCGREGRGPAVLDKPTALATLLAQAAKRPGGALLWRAEPGDWLAALGCNGRREPVDVSGLLDAWSPLRTSIGPGSPALSLIGCLDPARLDAALNGSDDGRAARLLYAWPAPAPWRSLRERPALRECEVVTALERIARLAGDPDRPLVLALDERAIGCFDKELARLHAALQGCDGIEAAWLGKGRNTLPRLAAALTLLNWAANASSVAPSPATIPLEMMSAAGHIWTYFRQHALAVLTRAFRSDGDRLRRRVLFWIRERRIAEVSCKDVRRHALAQALDAHQSLELIRSLERAGWLSQVPSEPGRDGRPAVRWNVNPALIGDAHAGSAETSRTSNLLSP
jgi:hypothetical protein